VLGPISHYTLMQRAAETIKRFILAENLLPGAQLPGERELSETLIVSRNIIREALSALVAEGILARYPGKGTFVRDFDRQRAAESVNAASPTSAAPANAIFEARVALELGALEFIVRRITGEELEKLAAVIDRHELKRQQKKSGVKEDIDFHLVLLQSAKNPVLMDTMPLVTQAFRDTLAAHPGSVARTEEAVIAEHRSILDALRRHDALGARRCMWVHLMEDPRALCQKEG
jgi:GntR family transcriptional regulator, transcriptional repressor for pyruvate dehydrogenase complex